MIDAKEIEEKYLAKFFYRYPIVASTGKGALLTDNTGKTYVDCMGGYGAAIIGHCHPLVVEAINEQTKKLISCHPSLYNETRARALNALQKIAPPNLQRIFLSNSGAESIECALKLALKFTGKKEIISFVGGFHGKTLGALSITWNKKYRRAFESALYPNVKFAHYGNIEEVEKIITDETAAIFVEPIQGESGVKIPPDGFLKGLRDVTTKHGSLLIVDEIQTGFGRTGKMWACQHWEVVPDILCAAKGIAAGIPMGATFSTEEIMGSLNVGEHSSTFGGNPVACAAAEATIKIITNEGLVEKANNNGRIFKNGLINLQNSHSSIREVRGMGLMLAAELKNTIYKTLQNIIGKGVIPLYSGKNILRFLPPLVINSQQIDSVLSVLDDVLTIEEKTTFGDTRPKVSDEFS